MKTKRVFFLLSLILLIAGILSISLSFAAGSQVNSTTHGFITEYPVPGAPQNLIIESVGPPASIWFTLPDANALGHLVITTTQNYTVTLYTPPTENSEPFDLALDPNANSIWFTERAGNQIGRLDLNQTPPAFTEFPVRNNNSPLNIKISPNGDVWFTEPFANNITKFIPGPNSFTPYPYTQPNGQPSQIAIANEDSIWITAPGANRIAELVPSTATYEHDIPVADFGSSPVPPSDIALNSDEPWILTPTTNRVGRYILETLAFFQWFNLPSENSGANSLYLTKINSNKHLWFTEPNLGRVGRIVLDLNNHIITINEHGLSSAQSQPSDIIVDTNGDAWIADYGGQAIAQWTSPYNFTTFLPVILK